MVINITEIKEALENDGELLFRGKPLSSKWVHRFLNALDSTFYVNAENENAIYLDDDATSGNQYGRLRLNAKSITLISPWLKDIQFSDNGDSPHSLASIINSRQLFTITFNSPEYIYLSRKIFRDRGLRSHVNEIRSAIEVQNFVGVNSEKGTFTLRSRSFQTNSIFHFVESRLRFNNSILVCDDLGDEWADFLEFRIEPSTCRLLHCKFGQPSSSASQLHEVISQALKNIGRVSITDKEILAKGTKWRDHYGETQIPRIRTGHSFEELSQQASSI